MLLKKWKKKLRVVVVVESHVCSSKLLLYTTVAPTYILLYTTVLCSIYIRQSLSQCTVHAHVDSVSECIIIKNFIIN